MALEEEIGACMDHIFWGKMDENLMKDWISAYGDRGNSFSSLFLAF